ncbi:MAG TPA: lytic murein transglycosylase B [Rhodocyclaceae bacterium]|jgi:membrane-bound lytic murein transglycosylase B|nr:lytic murein transglycosylase B [Rhodocyclaceae bacterium]
MKFFRTLAAISVLALSSSAWSTDAQGIRYSERADVKTFIAEMQQKNGLSATWLNLLFDQADFKPAVIKAILPPVDPQIRSWKTYRSRFVEPKRIAAGVRFWHEHAATIRSASEKYGVPEEIIASIIGVETIYGKNMGKFETFSALTTLAFDYPPRAALFRTQLEELLLLAKEEGRSPRSYQGSFAGALGLPQFLPSSIRRYAVDFDNDGDIDLTSPADAIGSVAHFLSEHGWVKGAPITVPVQIDDAAAAPLLQLGISPQKLPSEMVGLVSKDVPDENAALIDFVTPNQATEYWLGYWNFYVITRYNRSTFYAMAVRDLAEALKAKR